MPIRVTSPRNISMQKSAAIACFGVRYEISGDVITETLGEAQVSCYRFQFPTLSDALGAAENLWRQCLTTRVWRLSEITGTKVVRLRLRLASWGLYPRKAEDRAEILSLPILLASAKEALAAGFTAPSVVLLPEDIRLANVLAIGSSFYIVRADALSAGIKLEEKQIGSIDIVKSDEPLGVWDFTAAYHDTEGKYRFGYDAKDTNDSDIKCNVYGARIFLRRKDAVAHAQKIAQELAHRIENFC
jgi:hypothetical protein